MGQQHQRQQNEEPQNRGQHLWDALYFRNVDTINILLNEGEDINWRNDYCRNATPLQFAIEMGWFEIATLLIRRGADVNILDSDSDSALGVAIEQENLAIIQQLLAQGAIIDRPQPFAPLKMAIFRNNRRIIDQLLDAGASFDFAAQTDTTPVEYAAMLGNQELVHHLLQRGASLSLHVSAAIGDLVVIQRHIQTRGDIDRQSGQGRSMAPTLLYMAVVNNQLAVAQFLLEHGANPHIWCHCDNVALMAACERGLVEMVRLLIKHGADFGRWNMLGGVLANAAASGSVELMQFLLDEHGQTLRAHGETLSYGENQVPLTTITAEAGHLPMLKFLLAQGVAFPMKQFLQLLSREATKCCNF